MLLDGMFLYHISLSSCSWIHPGIPRLWNKGIPTHDVSFEDAKAKAIHDEAHVPVGDSTFLPHELILLKAHSISQNSLYDYMIYVILIWSCRSAMRASFIVGGPSPPGKLPIPGLTDDSFEPRIWYTGPEGQTQGFAFTYKDKNGNRVKITIWKDVISKDFSAPCHYLVFRYLLGSTGGFLFPSKAEIERLSHPDCTDRVVRESIGYASNTSLGKLHHRSIHRGALSRHFYSQCSNGLICCWTC
jgi:hypothetical protein